ncbi:MAG: 30S ribosomal protein S3, partial [Halanaerobiales bacterium]
MGQKVDPRGLRVGIIRDWDAKWYADKKNFATLLNEDLKIRDYIKKNLYDAGISRIVIDRAANQVKLDIYTARPGMVIGRGGSEVDNLRQTIEQKTGRKVQINVIEIDNPDLDAQLVAE